MHSHCEVIIPPDSDVEKSVESILKPFDENLEAANGFWDWYVIGGRFAGTKAMGHYDEDKVAQFHDWCQKENVTVSGIQCGKQELSPKTQIAKVDAKWNEMFPSPGGIMVACPIFKHSNDPYGKDGDGTLDGDICRLCDVPANQKYGRVIVGGPSFDPQTEERTGPLEAIFMLCDSQWNGVNFMDVVWDGTISDCLRQLNKKLRSYKDAYREQMTPTDDWVAVTVDYHS